MTEQVAEKTNRQFEILASEFPLACPRADQSLWNMHPKVFIAKPANGKATCPYCGTHYIVKG